MQFTYLSSLRDNSVCMFRQDNRSVSELTETELTSIQLTNGRVPSLHEVLKAIGASNGRYNAMHVKGNRQEPEHLKVFRL
mmetsp:Transcript_26188/g.37217  ORF Transcript_26188/g.37217 Transcript_26188/m.37217 type:complete len:80 (-) Transcript_26188:24-263(-)